MSLAVVNRVEQPVSQVGQGAHEVLKNHAANELVFAVVGHVGSGTTTIADKLQELLSSPNLDGGAYEVVLLKARDVIVDWARQREHLSETPARGNFQDVIKMQDLGDAMRIHDHAAVARALIAAISAGRARSQGKESGTALVKPDGKRRAYIVDALRHPTEVHLLRSLYRNSFALVGVVCQEDTRIERLRGKFPKNAGDEDIRNFMERDEKDPDPDKKHGQRVSDAFHLADYFIDNSEERYQKKEEGQERQENPEWNVPDQLLRLVRIVNHSRVERPTISETAMHAAYGSQMRSACLSRQVGAALVDRGGNLVATGANEVPRAGGGIYRRDADDSDAADYRCAYRNRYCSNTREQNSIIAELISSVPQLKELAPEARAELQKKLRRSRLGGLLEFSRAVHAEMDALLSAARMGASTQGCRLFVTTFPCHYCARHIVSAGVDEVQYIEPYPKSRALALHGDSITRAPRAWTAPSKGGGKVLFRPFTGVAPRLYMRAFLKDRDLKLDADGKMQMGTPDWGTAWDISKVSHVELELLLTSSTTPGDELANG
ncbi:anti-phage dCTP deaminase [Myxococcus sp. MxC21-1]|uniref:anti-phage dCTP deaminase n=1 Tax=Myxococcus sp. MxC21-1 TaxID=3041439 RepID=UPI002930A4C7|nr:anti-phage dCTP deaminase [Myxococcus sp. MxC21-1]WNZ64012.1 anti-phage dCTP deaminase [Myxococcus sp. MxC21-1]